MMAPGHLDDVRAIVRNGGYDKVTQILEGAGTRNETTARALPRWASEECNVLFHDAVRPLVTQRIIADCVEALDDLRGGGHRDPVGRHRHPGRRADAERSPTCSRGTVLRRGQTPQAFRLSTIRAAYAKARRGPRLHRDRRLHRGAALPARTCRSRSSPGDERNMKVTEPIDVYIADKLFQLTSPDLPAPRTDERVPRGARRQDVRRLRRLATASARDIADLAARARRRRVTRSRRSATRTHVERREDVAAAPASRCWPRPGGSTSS